MSSNPHFRNHSSLAPASTAMPISAQTQHIAWIGHVKKLELTEKR